MSAVSLRSRTARGLERTLIAVGNENQATLSRSATADRLSVINTFSATDEVIKSCRWLFRAVSFCSCSGLSHVARLKLEVRLLSWDIDQARPNRLCCICGQGLVLGSGSVCVGYLSKKQAFRKVSSAQECGSALCGESERGLRELCADLTSP